ncbi:sigma-70 family RNA polymerase sigma factor [Aureimonas fodinaquatilis]|uniref:Sigma-70 family RNA polymerase sigma factor n=1 Tax=Aureimonas fodinaquatilis TaxID=2565783 RepID=A0A5B0DSR7_9HYPH|nr:sigma-70 family RNA polymerase sigma factor [Aureimonas fodinaquatilis]KAA0969052.1 sigma-70 family RNA polymerase sigma factor [Aureimonas fodinaquatilis]
MFERSEISDLLTRIARGDRQALAQLFDDESGRLVAIAQRIVRRRDLAEEVVQEVFIAVWHRASQFDPGKGSGRNWLITMTRNRALNMIRDDARVEYHDAEVLIDIGDRQHDAVAAYNALAEQDALRTCLNRLDEPKRQAILLCYVTGLNHGEAAATMRAPLGTVKAWIRRGVVALQECLS